MSFYKWSSDNTHSVVLFLTCECDEEGCECINEKTQFRWDTETNEYGLVNERVVCPKCKFAFNYSEE